MFSPLEVAVATRPAGHHSQCKNGRASRMSAASPQPVGAGLRRPAASAACVRKPLPSLSMQSGAASYSAIPCSALDCGAASPPGRPKGEYRSAQHGGYPVNTNTSIGPDPAQGGNEDHGNADGCGNKTLGDRVKQQQEPPAGAPEGLEPGGQQREAPPRSPPQR